VTRPCSRRWAALLCLALALTAAVAAWGARPPDPLDRQRDIGYGEIRFRGAGPEKWAQRWRQEHAKTLQLHRLLVTRVDRLAGIIAGLLCIHTHEGSWTDSGAPFYGGLQMDLSFQRVYGGRSLQQHGTANNWTVGEQLAAGVQGYLARGWQPWPNTSRMCGLR
jgi:hypothetical protein